MKKTGSASSIVTIPRFSEVVVGLGGDKAAGLTGASNLQLQDIPAEKLQPVIEIDEQKQSKK